MTWPTASRPASAIHAPPAGSRRPAGREQQFVAVERRGRGEPGQFVDHVVGHFTSQPFPQGVDAGFVPAVGGADGTAGGAPRPVRASIRPRAGPTITSRCSAGQSFECGDGDRRVQPVDLAFGEPAFRLGRLPLPAASAGASARPRSMAALRTTRNSHAAGSSGTVGQVTSLQNASCTASSGAVAPLAGEQREGGGVGVDQRRRSAGAVMSQ